MTLVQTYMLSPPLEMEPRPSDVDSLKMLTLKESPTRYATWYLCRYAKTMISCDPEENLLFKHCAAVREARDWWTAEILERMMLTCVRYRRCLANILCEKKINAP